MPVKKESRFPYRTFNGLDILFYQDTERLWVVSLKGEREKMLYHGPNMGAAKKVADDLIEHYERRRAEEF